MMPKTQGARTVFTILLCAAGAFLLISIGATAVSYTHLTLPTILRSCRSRWSPYH